MKNTLSTKVLDEAIAKMKNMLSKNYVVPKKEYLLLTPLNKEILTNEFFSIKNVQYEEFWGMRHYYIEN